MNAGIWYALGAIVFLTILFILFDNRKKIFKKREKKAKEPKEPSVKETKKEQKNETRQISNPKLSLFKKVKKEPEPEPQIEDAEIDDLNSVEETYQSTTAFNQYPRRRPYPQTVQREPARRIYTPEVQKKKKIKDQIKDLSPEMKAILFTDALGKHEDK